MLVFCRLVHHALYVGSPHTLEPPVSSAGNGLVACGAADGGRVSYNYSYFYISLSDHDGCVGVSLQLTCAASVLLGLFLS